PPPAAGELRPGLPLAAPDEPPPEMKVELVQELIKKLADELNTATAPGVGATPPARAPDPEAMINRSVSALEATARGMHARRRIKTPTGTPPPDAGPAGKEVPTRRPIAGPTPAPTPAPTPGPTPGPIAGTG